MGIDRFNQRIIYNQRKQEMSTKVNAYTAYTEDLCDEFDLILRAPKEGYESYSLYARLQYAITQVKLLNRYIEELKAIKMECPELAPKIPPLG